MTPLASAAPRLMPEVSSALASAGYESLAAQLQSGKIERCTYDDNANAGYIYFVRPKPSADFANLSAPVAKTIPFLGADFNVYIDHDGNVFGVEFLDRSDFVSAS